MRHLFLLAPLCLLSTVLIGDGAPITGAFAKKVEIGPEPWTETKRFRGGERATVLVAGKGRVPPMVQVTVYDDNGKLIAEEKGKDPPSVYMVGFFWYPPRDANYRIEVRHFESGKNDFFVTIK